MRQQTDLCTWLMLPSAISAVVRGPELPRLNLSCSDPGVGVRYTALKPCSWPTRLDLPFTKTWKRFESLLSEWVKRLPRGAVVIQSHIKAHKGKAGHCYATVEIYY